MRILVTGSSGMLGTDLCSILSARHNVIGIDMAMPKDEKKSPARFIEASITDEDSISAIIEKERPECVIHTAAWAEVDNCELNPAKAAEINVKGTENMAKALKKSAIPLVYISTDFVFDGTKKDPYKEDDATNPLSVYGKTKYEGEQAVRRELSNYAIVRTSWLFGRYGKNFVDTMIAKASAGEKLKVVDDQVGSPTYTVDLARTTISLIEKKSGVLGASVYHCCNSGKCSWYEFAEKIFDYKGLKNVDMIPIISAELDRPAKRPAFSVMDNSKVQKDSGFKLRTWQEALREYIG